MIKYLIAFVIMVIFVGSVCSYYFSSEIVIVNDKDYFKAVHSEMQNANYRIHVIMYKTEYYSNKDKSINKLIEDLVRANDRDVDVKIIMEGGESYTNLPNRYPCYYLTEQDVPIKYDKYGTTTHSKLVIIDDKVIIGSTNWGQQALFENKETNVLIQSKDISDKYESYFQDLWKESKSAEC